MTAVLPWSLIVVATILLAVALLSFWQSLRAAFGLSDVIEVESEGDEDERRSLLQQKDALLENLQDLAFEHEAGKLSDEDFRALEARLRGQAKAVLRKLDEDVAPFRAKAEELVSRHLAKAGVKATPASEPAKAAPVAEPAKAAPAAPSAQAACGACGTANDADAVFCKKCGAKLAASTEGASEAEDA
ncbi:MAG: zinc ribbon domain-containing protein [Polyangiales bacterium]